MKKLKEQLRQLNIEVKKTKEQLQLEYNKVYDDIIPKYITQLENSETYTFSQCGDIEQWTAIDLNIPNEELEYLENYLDDHCITLDKKNMVISNCIESGYEYYSIDECGTVFMNQEKLFNIKDFDNESEFYQAIENDMEKNGHYPGVYYVGYYGDVMLDKDYYNWLKGVKNAD